MADIKTNETHLEHGIKIKWLSFDGLLIMRMTWLHLEGPSEIKRP